MFDYTLIKYKKTVWLPAPDGSCRALRWDLGNDTRESGRGAGTATNPPRGARREPKPLTRGDPRPGVGMKAAGSSRGCPGRVVRAVQVHLRPRSARGTPHLGLRQRPGAASEEGKPPVPLRGATDCADLTHTKATAEQKKISKTRPRATNRHGASSCADMRPTPSHQLAEPAAPRQPPPGCARPWEQHPMDGQRPAARGSAGSPSQSWGSGRAGTPAGTWAGQHGSGAHKCTPGSTEPRTV